MGMFTDYFVATPERAMTLADAGPGGQDVPKLELKWVEPGVLGSTLWAIIEDAPVPEGYGLPFDIRRFSADGPMLFACEEYTHGLSQISDGFVRALAALPDERIAPVAARWATAEEWGVEWAPGELDDTVRGLRDLAREVRFPEQHMYLWWCM
ncbi:hypothetical protein Val02_12790 [Virgisporangium aliadipatigenens]|uniref:Uncharacterized protein n=1 Tax=Virgisporangium aliadipatigenens TaxID=741659 RepID=A0A8J3YI62_9ACTN|nr:hypothetical protein [Virgisporangium aliadipatigenens]GIJ44393.1 hypothetical protein Val02_12790 [Virgisporangium aliadipatigenens]